ncbi:MAG TPA: Vms1/Ankzf1 family peptidyl-tRNA hydrolase [Gaiellaceae bacterium]|nr:Vms1/Ankzf1 family peptidyl-tRNA hydrolase [Gaiellaceae bacterium]
MTTTVTDNVLRELAGFRTPSGCAISIYLDLDPSTAPTIPEVETRFNAALAEAEKLAEEHPRARDCRMALREDLQRIREWWDREFERGGARGLALFASSTDDLFRALPLVGRVADLVRVGHTLTVAPLVGELGLDGDIVAVVSRERGTVYRLLGGRLVEVVDESEETPGQHHQGGWSQARYQRHIDNLVQQHLKTVGSEIDKRARRGGAPRIAIVAPEETRSELVAALATETREAIVGYATAEAHAGPAELLEAVRPMLDEARARDEEAALERWREAHGRGERSAAGWKQVLDAASDARVSVLLVDESAQREAWNCPECGRASADGGSCPLDGTKLEAVPDAVDLAIHQVLANGGSVVRLGTGALGDVSGIAALLRF